EAGEGRPLRPALPGGVRVLRRAGLVRGTRRARPGPGAPPTSDRRLPAAAARRAPAVQGQLAGPPDHPALAHAGGAAVPAARRAGSDAPRVAEGDEERLLAQDVFGLVGAIAADARLLLRRLRRAARRTARPGALVARRLLRDEGRATHGQLR